MPIYAVVIAQMPSINTPTIRRLLRWPLPTFWSSADLETWMLDCHWLIARDLCVYACFYAAYQINPSPWNGTQTAIAYTCAYTRGDLCRSINHNTCVSVHFRLHSWVCVLRHTEYNPGLRLCSFTGVPHFMFWWYHSTVKKAESLDSYTVNNVTIARRYMWSIPWYSTANWDTKYLPVPSPKSTQRSTLSL